MKQLAEKVLLQAVVEQVKRVHLFILLPFCQKVSIGSDAMYTHPQTEVIHINLSEALVHYFDMLVRTEDDLSSKQAINSCLNSLSQSELYYRATL